MKKYFIFKSKKIIGFIFISLFFFHCKNNKGKNTILPLVRDANNASQTQTFEKEDLLKKLLEDKLKQSISFEHINKNEISKIDYKKVDFSISGDFIGDLTAFKQVNLTYQVSAGDKQSTSKKIIISPEFIKKKTIPLFLDLSSFQPDYSAVSSKLKLIFEVDKKEIEWTENFYLPGKKQLILFTNLKDQEIQEGILYNQTTTLKLKLKGQQSSGLLVQVNLEDVSGNDANGDFSIDPPAKDKISRPEYTFPLDANKRYLVKARTYFRINDSEDWQAIGDTVYRSYSLYNAPADFRIEMNKFIVRKGEEIRFTVTKMRKLTDIYYYYDKDQTGIGISPPDLSTIGSLDIGRPGGSYIRFGLYGYGPDYLRRPTCVKFCDPVNDSIPEGVTVALMGIKRSFNINFKISRTENIVVKILVRP